MDVSVVSELRYLTRGSRVPVAQSAQLWVVEVIAPFGGAEDISRTLTPIVFPGREAWYTNVAPQGKRGELV